MSLRGIRGAITIKKNSRAEIIEATEMLLKKIITANKIKQEDVASIIFSVTSDLNAEFPAVAARKFGLSYTPLLCTYEIDVPGSLKRCIRVLIHINTRIEQKDIKNIYIGDAKKLRSDF